MSSTHLHGRRVLITGGSSGIGSGLVAAFAEAGADVMAVGRDRTRLEAAAAASSREVSLVVADLTTPSGRRAVATAVEHRHGALDVVIHAAGALGPVRTPEARLVNYPEQDWYDVFETNVSAVHFLHQELARFLDQGRQPTLIGVSSSVGRAGRAEWGMYAVSKFALEGWLETLADEWPEGRVYSVNPGGTATPMRAAAMPAEDPATLPTPADIAAVFLHLAHPRSQVPTAAKVSARDWIGRDPWADLAATGDEI